MRYVIVSIDNTRQGYKEAIRARLEGWTEVFIPAVNGNRDVEINAYLEYHNVPPITFPGLKVGQLGRWLSFLNHLEKLDGEPLFVIEDDGILSRDFIDKVTPLLNDMPADADFFSLFVPRNRPTQVYSGGMYPAFGGPSNGTIMPEWNIGHDIIVRAHQPYGGVGMFLYPSMYEKIKEMLARESITGQFDDVIYARSQAGVLNGYSIVPDMPDLVNIIPGIPSTVHETKYYGE